MRRELNNNNFESEIIKVKDYDEISAPCLSLNNVDRLIEELKKCKKIKFLAFDRFYSEDRALNLANSLKEIQAIEELNLYGDILNIDGALALAVALKNIHNLQTLHLDYNKLGNAGIEALSELIRENHNIRYLTLSGNAIRNAGALILAEALADNNVLQELFLDNNQIEETGAIALFKILSVKSSLNSLDLSDNNIGNGGFDAAAQFLKSNINIKSLALGSHETNLDDEKLTPLAEVLSGSRIQSLYLKGQTVLGVDTNKLVEAIKQNVFINYYKGPGESLIQNILLQNKHIKEFTENLCFREALKDDFSIKDIYNQIFFDPKIQEAITILLERKLSSVSKEEIKQCIENLRFNLSLSYKTYEEIITKIPNLVEFSIDEAIPNFWYIKSSESFSSLPPEIINNIARFTTTSGFTFWKTKQKYIEQLPLEHGISEGKMEIEDNPQEEQSAQLSGGNSEDTLSYI
ncbi:MAG: hypothetical protein K0Q51_384 [Rickettsiaceae bacterium]|jgi:Ran GTPase-activating protein (RanGAP) involved in mRNA processing and transport|nr:hypothetical protein [Rickettsiaceae bacterium]